MQIFVETKSVYVRSWFLFDVSNLQVRGHTLRCIEDTRWQDVDAGRGQMSSIGNSYRAQHAPREALFGTMREEGRLAFRVAGARGTGFQDGNLGAGKTTL